MEEETANGLWDPGLMAKFLHLVRTKPDILALPTGADRDKSALIYDEIAASGILLQGLHKAEV